MCIDSPTRAPACAGYAPRRPFPAGPKGLTDVPGVLVGHAHDETALTGCTAILTPAGATGGYAIRGSAVGARELEPLAPGSAAPLVHGLLLTGGSAFGLGAASGVVRFLEQRGIGFPVRGQCVPIVPAAVLFDLGLGDGRVRPDETMGYAAAAAASDGRVAEGNVGAGCGASCGKLAGPEQACKSGLGTASRQLGDGLWVAALAAVNALGDIVDPASGEILAGMRESAVSLRLADAGEWVRVRGIPVAAGLTNTTLAVVATNARLSRVRSGKLAALAADALPRCIVPASTLFDGDIVFALATGELETDFHRLALHAREVLERALLRGATQARAAGGLPCAADLDRERSRAEPYGAADQ